MRRRRVLSLVGAGVVGSLAGCGGEEEVTDSIGNHPAAAGLADQPRLGELGNHVVLAFEDPSCQRCAAFHENTVPRLKSNLVEPGLGAYVVRHYPVVFPWGDPASHALEATFARSGAAYWDLLAHYFETRERFTQGNVLDRTETFLSEATDVDGAAVVADVESGAYDDAVAADVSAAEAAGLGETTPVVLLFRDGDYVTKVNGSVGYEVVAEALGVAE